MSEVNRLKILEKVAAGEISASAAADILQSPEAVSSPANDALKKAEQAIVITEDFGDDKPIGKSPSWFRVRVNDLNSGQQRVAVNIPFRMMKWGLRMGKRLAPELQDLDVTMLENMAADGGTGMLVEVMDSDSGDHVQIFLE